MRRVDEMSALRKLVMQMMNCRLFPDFLSGKRSFKYRWSDESTHLYLTDLLEPYVSCHKHYLLHVSRAYNTVIAVRSCIYKADSDKQPVAVVCTHYNPKNLFLMSLCYFQ